MDLSRETIRVEPLDAMRALLREVDAGRIRVVGLEVTLNVAMGGHMDFNFQGTAIAVDDPGPPPGLSK